MESIVGSRTGSGSNNRVQENILATMLNEMDGVGVRKDTKLDPSLVRQTNDVQMMKPGDSSLHNCRTDSLPDTEQSQVIFVGATNRPDMIDPAILRPGRIDKRIYVPPPDLKSRESILKIQLSKMTTLDVDIEELSRKSEFFSGADLKNLCNEAGLIAWRENKKDIRNSNLVITNSNFTQAFEFVKPSITESMLKK